MDASHSEGTSPAQSAGNPCFIASVPVEILRQILLQLPLFSREQLERRVLTRAPSTIAIYQVCKHWRTVVQEIPELWTIIPLPNDCWAARALLYSKPLPITIHVDLGRVHASEAYRKTVHRVLRHAARARELSFTWPPAAFLREGFVLCDFYLGHVEEMMGLLDNIQAPLLESFTFSDLPVYTQGLPEGIFCGKPLPRLRHLTLSHIELTSDMPLLRSPLTALKLHVCSIISDEDLSDQEDEDSPESGGSTRLILLLEILRELPTLESFIVCGMYLEDLDPDTCPQRGVALPNLKQLIMAGDVDELGFFFGCLALPIGIDLRIECSIGSPKEYLPFLPDSCTRVTFMLHEALASAVEAGLAFQDLHVKFRHHAKTNMDVLEIVASNPRHYSRAQSSEPTTRMSLTMRHKQHEWLVKDIMERHATTLLNTLPAIDDLKTISSDGWEVPEELKEKMDLVRK